MNNVSAILVGDMHLRDSAPVCRTDDYWDAQLGKLNFLEDLDAKYDFQVPFICAGDVFHHWKPSFKLLRLAWSHLNMGFFTIPGNHDLPQHNLGNLSQSGLGMLGDFGDIEVLGRTEFPLEQEGNEFWLSAFPFGSELGPPTISRDFSMAVVHTMVWEDDKHSEIFEGMSAKQLVDKMSGYDLILCGDNHKKFTKKIGNCWVVNPGSMMRMTADQIDHEPAVFLWDAENNEIEEVKFPINKNVVSQEHLFTIEERNLRLESFIRKLNMDIETELSFETNMQTFISKNKIASDVQEILEEVTG